MTVLCQKCTRRLPDFQAQCGLTTCDDCLIPQSWAWRHMLEMTEASQHPEMQATP